MVADTRRVLVVTAVEAEARAAMAGASAAGAGGIVVVIAGGIGRTNAAATTTQAILQRGPFDAVISAGIAGALPVERGEALKVGDCIAASECVYAEEGIVTAGGFAGMKAMGFSLGDFDGNAVPVDGALLDALGAMFVVGPIATVATCSGTDAAAREVVRRTGALAEAMEGAAVVHAARRLRVPAIEVRAISNTTGDRATQQWDMEAGMAALREAMGKVLEKMKG